MPSNPASALGEAAGKLFEQGVIESITPVVASYQHTVTPARLRNGSDNVYQIDAVVFDDQQRPIIIIDPKYIRYTKHNRDKASWLCTAHYNLRKTYPSLRKSIAVLGGRWSRPSRSLLDSFGVEILEVPFDHFCNVFSRYGIEFDWHERDRETPAESLEEFESLQTTQLETISTELVNPVASQLTESVEQVLSTSLEDVPHHVDSVEVLIKTDQNEMLLRQHVNIPDAISDLSNMLPTQTDISEII